MESLQRIQSRLKTVRNIGKITKAMEVVSATKMRRSQEVALKTRPYAYKVLALLETIHKNVSYPSVFMETRPVKNTLVLVVSSDRELAGSFNSQVYRTMESVLEKDEYARKEDHNFLFAAVGKKAVKYISAKKGELQAQFSGFGDYARPEQIDQLNNSIVAGFIKGKWDRVIAVSTHFRTTLKQDVISRQILPVNFQKIRETVKEMVPEYGKYSDVNGTDLNKEREVDYIIEPSPKDVIDKIMPHLIKMEVYQLILEANASEHSARMVAMKNASDNASDLSEDISLYYNKARQAAITKELIELTSTQNALN